MREIHNTVPGGFLKTGAVERAFFAFALLAASPAFAQRAAENAVTSANDAFGTSVGNESIGLYNPNDVRGFSPIQAGNVRLDGLYFDKVGDLNDRLQQSSRIQVGITAQGYAFPAPTGIVDYALRAPGDIATLSILSKGDSFGSSTLQLDGALPVSEALSLGGGIGYSRNQFQDGGNNYEATGAVLAKWNPIPNLEILPFWSRKDTIDQNDGESYQPAGDFLPPRIPARHFLGPSWAKSRDFSYNYGAILGYSSTSWVVRMGLFRSEKNKPVHHFPLLVNLDRNGQGELDVYADPPARSGSTSGELRVEKSFAEGPRTHRLIFSLRGRDWNAIYGNSLTVDAGPQAIGQRVNAPKPVLSFAPSTHDHVDERALGAAYQLEWSDRGQIGIAAQKLRYHKDTLIPGAAPVLSDATPWLISLSGTLNITADLAAFAATTQGLEESGIAPSNAANSNEALPAVTTRQKEVGLRWIPIQDVNLVASLFDLKKPYFNLDEANVFRELGELENKGLELSLSGNITDRLDVVAGGVFTEPSVAGDAVRLGLTGRRPVGIPSRKFVLDVNWQPPGAENLSFDAGLTHSGSEPGTLDDVVTNPAHTLFNVDARYQFELSKHAASLKFAIQNIADLRGFHVDDADTYNIFNNAGRNISLRLIVDLGST